MTASLTILGEDPVAVDVSLQSLTEDRMDLICPAPLDLGLRVKVVQDGTLWLGLVIESKPGNLAVVQIEHLLRNIGELALRTEQFLGGASTQNTKTTTLS